MAVKSGFLPSTFISAYFIALLLILCHGAEDPEKCSQQNTCQTEAEGAHADRIPIDESLNELQQGRDDPKLVSIIREKYLVPPAGRYTPYNFTKNPVDLGGQYGQPWEIDTMFQQRQNGFFIEAGAFDGERFSNSLFFEMKRGWTGLLIEPNWEVFQRLKSKNRKAWLLPTCLSTKTTPEVVEFDTAGLLGGIINQRKPGDPIGQVLPNDLDNIDKRLKSQGLTRSVEKMQCFPLYSVLLAMGNPTVDYFSLDIEGAEYPVLRNLPLDQVDIRLMEIEAAHLGTNFPGSLSFLEKYLNRFGYSYIKTLEIDRVYVKNEYKDSFKLN